MQCSYTVVEIWLVSDVPDDERGMTDVGISVNIEALQHLEAESLKHRCITEWILDADCKCFSTRHYKITTTIELKFLLLIYCSLTAS